MEEPTPLHLHRKLRDQGVKAKSSHGFTKSASNLVSNPVNQQNGDNMQYGRHDQSKKNNNQVSDVGNIMTSAPENNKDKKRKQPKSGATAQGLTQRSKAGSTGVADISNKY